MFQKTIIITGSTASGKSDLAIELARVYHGEIISADSRQVYRGMDIGSGKVTKREQKLAKHHLLDVANPNENYNITHFLRDAKKATLDIKKRGKVPIVCGGTGFWIQAFIEETSFPKVEPNRELREKLALISTEKLFQMLKQKDPVRAETIDRKNKVRLIRALEIIEALGSVPELPSLLPEKTKNFLIIALTPSYEILRENIKIRLQKRLKKGMISEVKKLHADGLSYKKLEAFGLEYRYISLYLQKKLPREKMEEELFYEICHYAKRQITWLRRMETLGANIHWITDPKEAFLLVSKEA